MRTLLLFCLTCLAATQAAAAQDPAAAEEGEAYVMNDVGGELLLPDGWEMQEWSDWSFKAKTDDGVLMRLYLSPFQVEPTVEAGKAWAGMYQERLEDEGGGEFSEPVTAVASVKLADGDTQVVTTDLGFTFIKQATAGVLHAVAIPGAGQVVHIETISAARNDRKAQQALTELLAGFTVKQKPEAPTARVESGAHFAFSAPDGWRAPLKNELAITRGVTGKVGEQGLDPEKCAVIVRPHAVGDPDAIFACELYKYLGPVDEYSWEGMEKEVNQTFFGRWDVPVDAAEKVDMGDRLGFLYKPPIEGIPLRLAVAPYDKGLVVMWGVARQIDDAELDAAVHQVLPTIEYTGPDGGAPLVALDKRIIYYLTYRPTSPVVLGPAVGIIAIIGGFVMLSRRRRSRYEDI